jgi:hypothetical protein
MASLFVILVKSPEQRAAALLGLQNCHEEPSYCAVSVPAYGGGTKHTYVPCLKKVCRDNKPNTPGNSTTGSGSVGR